MGQQWTAPAVLNQSRNFKMPSTGKDQRNSLPHQLCYDKAWPHTYLVTSQVIAYNLWDGHWLHVCSVTSQVIAYTLWDGHWLHVCLIQPWSGTLKHLFVQLSESWKHLRMELSWYKCGCHQVLEQGVSKWVSAQLIWQAGSKIAQVHHHRWRLFWIVPWCCKEVTLHK